MPSDELRRRVYENEGLAPLVELVDPGDVRVIDVGCGAGDNLELLSKRGHEATGVTISEAEAGIVRRRGFECLVCDVERDEIPLPPACADGLLFSHVLEHVAWPAEVLRRCLRLLRPGGGVYAAFPNAVQFHQRWRFLKGEFRYTETGLLDRTHLRFFDFVSARRLLEDADIEITAHEAVGHFPQGPARTLFGGLASRLDAGATRRWPGLFGFHILVAGRWRPNPGRAT